MLTLGQQQPTSRLAPTVAVLAVTKRKHHQLAAWLADCLSLPIPSDPTASHTYVDCVVGLLVAVVQVHIHD